MENTTQKFDRTDFLTAVVIIFALIGAYVIIEKIYYLVTFEIDLGHRVEYLEQYLSNTNTETIYVNGWGEDNLHPVDVRRIYPN